MISFVVSALKIIFLLGFLIFIHELGHFTVAKICKVKVNEFAIGFGPKIWSKQGKETKYSLRLLPLGGYVSLEGEEQKSEDTRAFNKASIPKRVAIVSAGAVVNIIFGLLVYFILMYGTGTYITNEVDSIIEGFVAQEIGLQEGDKIIQINEEKINNKNDLNKILEKLDSNEIKLNIKRNEEVLTYNIKPTEVKTKTTGMYIDEKCKVIAVEKESSGEKAGIKANDIIIEINNEKVDGNIEKATQLIQQEGESQVLLKIKRGNQEIKIELEPDYIYSYYLGVNLKQAEDNSLNRIKNAGMETSEFAFSIIDNLKQLFTGKVGIEQMTGPVGISEAVAKTNGIREFIYLLALVSLSLGVTNLLPIPALDGGKILILIIEAIIRKPLDEKLETNLQLIGFSLIIGLAILVTYNDILRIM